LGSLYY